MPVRRYCFTAHWAVYCTLPCLVLSILNSFALETVVMKHSCVGTLRCHSSEAGRHWTKPSSITTTNATLAGVAANTFFYILHEPKNALEKPLHLREVKASVLKMAVMLFSNEPYFLAKCHCSFRVTVPPTNSPFYKLLQYYFSLQRLGNPLLSLFLPSFRHINTTCFTLGLCKWGTTGAAA